MKEGPENSKNENQEKPRPNRVRGYLEKEFGTPESRRIERSGYLTITRGGNGFVSTPKYGDVQIQKESLSTAFGGDYVEVKVTKGRTKDSVPEGNIVGIEHKRDMFVGDIMSKKFPEGNTEFLLKPQGTLRDHPPFILTGNVPRNLQEEDKVLVKFKKWDDSSKMPQVDFIQKLGVSDDLDAERRAIPYIYGFSPEFPKEVEAEAKKISETEREISKEERLWRKDLTHLPFVTIDPEGAADIDDAVHVEKLDNGNIRVIKAIADVSHYVKPGSAIEKEAIKRGTSVYFPNSKETLHMLPSVLSSDLCSLNENQERRAFCFILEINPKTGEVVEKEFKKAIIKSQKQFSYKKAQEMLQRELKRTENKENETEKKWFGLKKKTTEQGLVTTQAEPEEHAEMLKLAWEVTRSLKDARIKAGAVELGNSSERQHQFNKSGEVTQITSKKKYDTMSIIEELALATNRAVGEFLVEMYAGNKNFTILRTHPAPRPDKILELKKVLLNLSKEDNDEDKKESWKEKRERKESEEGERANLKKAAGLISEKGAVTSEGLSRLLTLIAGHTTEELILERVLRAMLKASYTTEEMGHFSLNFDLYAQATSPIRRLADIFVHRSLWRNLDKDHLTRSDMNEYLQIAQIATERSRAADKAQQEMEELEDTAYFAKPDEMIKERKAQIVDVFDNGVRLRDKKTGVEGILWRNRLGHDWILDSKDETLVHRKTKKKYKLGETFSVSVDKTDFSQRRIHWKPFAEEVKSPRTKNGTTPKPPEKPLTKEGVGTKEVDHRTRINEIYKSFNLDAFPEKIRKNPEQARKITLIAGILNAIRDMKDLSQWPNDFQYTKTGKISFIGKFENGDVRLSKESILFPETPEKFLQALEKFLANLEEKKKG